MPHLLLHLVGMLRAATSDRTRLAIENMLLRQQFAFMQRSVIRSRIRDSDRVFWILARTLIKNWSEHLVIVKPETVIRWHRQGFAYY